MRGTKESKGYSKCLLYIGKGSLGKGSLAPGAEKCRVWCRVCQSYPVTGRDLGMLEEPGQVGIGMLHKHISCLYPGPETKQRFL